MLGKTYYKLSENLLNVLNTKNKEKDSNPHTHNINTDYITKHEAS